jgi:hypothetical protein
MAVIWARYELAEPEERGSTLADGSERTGVGHTELNMGARKCSLPPLSAMRALSLQLPDTLLQCPRLFCVLPSPDARVKRTGRDPADVLHRAVHGGGFLECAPPP